MSAARSPLWRVEREAVTSEESVELLRDYLVDVSDRWFQREQGRDSSAAEIEQGLAQMTSDDLEPPSGVFLLARREGRVEGCVGLRVVDATTVALTRMFVRRAHRHTGVATLLLLAAEDAARELGSSTIQLDTRRDLVEARSLYQRQGFSEVVSFNHDVFAEVWYAKDLGGGR